MSSDKKPVLWMSTKVTKYLGVTHRQLHKWEKDLTFLPHHKDENGYRYYLPKVVMEFKTHVDTVPSLMACKVEERKKQIKKPKTQEPQKADPLDLRKPHPVYKDRDRHGRVLPGSTQLPTHGRTHLATLRNAMQETLDASDIRNIVLEVYRLALHGEDDATRLEASNLLLDRLFGKPSKEFILEVQQTQVLDATRLSDQELDNLISLTSKAINKPQSVIEYKENT